MQRNRRTRLLKPAIIIAAVLIALLAVAELTGTTHLFNRTSVKTYPKTPTTGGASVNSDKGEPRSSTSPKSGTQTQTTQPDNIKSPTTAPNSETLVTPTGNFVSNHKPSLSASPGPHETSVCTAAPGAICTISFSDGSTTKSLRSETTDAGGSAYWDWSVQDIDLTAGSWKITATATLNGQTKSATDPLELKVSQ